MRIKSRKITYPCFEKHLAKEMKDKKFRELFEKEGKHLEIAYQILQLRKKKRFSQEELAQRLNTTQSVVARMESGQQNFTTDTLQKIAVAFGKNLKIEFVK